MKTGSFVAVAFAGLAVAAAACAAPDEKTYSLVRKYVVGDTELIKAKIVATVNEADVPVSRSLITTVKEIDKKTGNTVMLYADQGGTYTLNGEERTFDKEPPSTLTFDKVGKLLKYVRPDSAPSPIPVETIQLMATLQACILPDKDVKAGDTWTSELDNPSLKNKKFTITSTFVGTESVGKIDMLKIKATASIDLEGGTPEADRVHSDVTFLLDPTTCRVVKLDGTVKNMPSPFGGPMNWVISMTVGKTDTATKAAATQP